MKTRYLIIVIVLLAGNCSIKSYAQDNIKEMIKKCENMDVIEADIVRYRNPKIKSMNRSTIFIKMLTSTELEKQLEEAFKQDSNKAIQVVEQKKDDRVSHMLYRFGTSTYSYTISNDTISIHAQENYPISRFRFW